jgi:dipeptidyl-peptidase 4
MKSFFIKLIFFLLIVQLSAEIKVLAQKLSLDLLYKSSLLTPEKLSGIKSMNDGIHYILLQDGNKIVEYSYETGEQVAVLFALDSFQYENIGEISEYAFNNDETMLLFASEREEIYRYSFYSNYYYYDLEKKLIKPLFTEGKQRLASLSPDGHYIAFVFNNNLYVKDIRSGVITNISYDGAINKIINGCPDWVYEEEFNLQKGFYWSDDSRRIAYYRFDESAVKDYNITYYYGIYPMESQYKYPKAGGMNSRVDILVYDLLTGLNKKLTSAIDTSLYIPRIKWLPDSKQLCITRLNRLQNKVELQIENVTDGNSYLFYTEKNDRYISEYTDDFVSFIDSGKQALIMSEKSGYMHIYRYRIDGSFVNQVTSGNWEVDEILGFDELYDRLYYTSTEISPLERHVYSICTDGSNKLNLTPENGFHHADFSASCDFYILTSSDANTPYVYSLYNRNNQLIRTINDNDRVRKQMEKFKFVKKEFFVFITANGDTLNGYQLLPPDFHKSRKYPVLVYVYGGPEYQSVTDEWESRMEWLQLLAQKGYIIVCADNRGTDGRGEAFKKCIYMQLGKLETEDQIQLAKYMGSKPYVDASRIGIFGWSYGGYMSLLCLMKGEGVFKMGVAVAPVTDWRFYDSVYTERFMRTPEENPSGYYNSSTLNYVDSLEGKLLLIHGTADDNVHLQNSMMLIQKMIEKDKPFEMQFFPNQDHSISGGNCTFYLFTRITDFIFTNL